MSGDIWSVLGITPTADAVSIKKAYAARLKHTKPQDDARAYQRLRQAYEMAMAQARAMPRREALAQDGEPTGAVRPEARWAPIAEHADTPDAEGAQTSAQLAQDESPQPGRQRFAEGDAQEAAGRLHDPERHRQRLHPDDGEALGESPQPGRQRFAEGDAQKSAGRAQEDPERHRQRLPPDDGEALGESPQPGRQRFAEGDAQEAARVAPGTPATQRYAPPDPDELLDDTGGSIGGHRRKNGRQALILGDTEAGDQQQTDAAPSLTAQVWAGRLDELMHSDSQARLRGPELIAQLGQLDLTERTHANLFALRLVLVHVHHGPLLGDLIDRLDREFEWTRDANWQQWVSVGDASRVMAVLNDLRRRRAEEGEGPSAHTHAQTQRWRPAAPADGADPLQLPAGWGHLFTLLKQRNWQPSTGSSLRLLLVLAVAFPLLTRPLHGDERVSPSLKQSALVLHVLGWLGLAIGAVMALGVPWPDAPVLALTGYGFAGLLNAVVRGFSRNQRVQRRGDRLATWFRKPWVVLVVLALPMALAGWVMRSPNELAVLGLAVLPYIGALFASDSTSWRARPGFNWFALLGGMGVLVLTLNNALLDSLGVAQVQVLVWLPFASGLLALAVVALSPWAGSPRGRQLVCLAVLGALVWVNVELALATHHSVLGEDARGPAWRVWLGVNAASWAAAGLLGVLWTSCARYSGMFWVNAIVMLGLWLVAKDRGNAALDAMPLLTICVLAMLTVFGLQRVADRVALKLVLRGLSG